MKLKMSELVEKSGVSKSTILFYLKEGLLPEPEKPKPNVHLYDPKTLKILDFIKYFQENLGYSIAQIKAILADNRIDFNSDSDLILEYLSAMENAQAREEAHAVRREAEQLGIDPELFKAYEACAKEIAKLEYEAGAKLLTSQHNNENNRLQKTLFDILLKLKPYIFNQATLEEHKKRTGSRTKDTSC